jgi:hypothetical protein
MMAFMSSKDLVEAARALSPLQPFPPTLPPLSFSLLSSLSAVVVRESLEMEFHDYLYEVAEEEEEEEEEEEDDEKEEAGEFIDEKLSPNPESLTKISANSSSSFKLSSPSYFPSSTLFEYIHSLKDDEESDEEGEDLGNLEDSNPSPFSLLSSSSPNSPSNSSKTSCECCHSITSDTIGFCVGCNTSCCPRCLNRYEKKKEMANDKHVEVTKILVESVICVEDGMSAR